MDFNDIIKNNFLHRYENNELKAKKLIITPFLNINKKNINDISFRPNLIADLIAKFYRQQNYNVMVNLNCNNLNDNYIINSKVEYSELNNNILFNYLYIIDKLNINYDYNKSIHLLDKEAINLYQNLFVFLYNNNLIKYEMGKVYFDPSYSYYYDIFNTNNFYHAKDMYGIYLDFYKYIPFINKNINSLLIDKEIKDKFKRLLGEEINYKLNLITNNNISFQIDLKEPYMIGSLGCILVGINTLDILEYINPCQISYLESYFKNRNLNYFDTKNFVVNPLTGKKIPVYLSKDTKGFKGLFYNDKDTLSKLNIEPINIINDNNLLINSDYLDSLTKESANRQLVKDFVSEGIIFEQVIYTNSKILLSSNNKYGVLAPVMIEDEKMFLLSSKLPIYYDSKFNLNGNGNFKVYDKPLNNSFYALFNYIINIIYDKDREIKKEINDELLYNIKRLLNNSLVIYNKGNETEEILLPIIMLTIFECLFSIKLLDRIEFLGVGQSYDNYGYEFKDVSNNLINYEQLLTLYNSDSIRLYLLSHNICDKLYFYKDNIFKYKQELYNLEMIVNSLSDYNPILDIESIRFKENILENMLSYNLEDVIKNIIKYISFLKDNKPSKQQFLELLVVLTIFIPNICDKINLNYYKNKIDLLSINWSKEM